MNDEQFHDKAQRMAELFADALRQQVASREDGTTNEHLAADDGDDLTFTAPSWRERFDAALSKCPMLALWLNLAVSGYYLGICYKHNPRMLWVAVPAWVIALFLSFRRAALIGRQEEG